MSFDGGYLANSLADLSGKPRNHPLYDLLNIPEPFVRDAWDDAFDKFMDALDGVSDDTNVLLTMHASIWSPESTSPFPVLNPASIAKRGFCADLVINLIDDVWDVLWRLGRPGQLFSMIASPTLDNEINQIITLLEWRQTEFRSSEMLAKCCSGAENHSICRQASNQHTTSACSR